MKPFVHRQVSDSMVADSRLKVREDCEKVTHWRTERSKQLDQVRLLDHSVDLWERAVQDGAAAVVKLVKRQIWRLHEAERAAIVREVTRPMSPAKDKSSSARNPSRSTPDASQAGPSRRLPSPTGHPIATNSPVGTRFVGTIPKIPTRRYRRTAPGQWRSAASPEGVLQPGATAGTPTSPGF